MIELYDHQRDGVKFLTERSAALLVLEMGLGKTRCSLVAAQELFERRKIDRVIILAPAAVRFSWKQELEKLSLGGYNYNLLRYDSKTQSMKLESHGGNLNGEPRLAIALVSYALLPQSRHVEALIKWADGAGTLLICDESSFLKSRTAKQTKGAARIAQHCYARWLLTGTPIANSPLDLYGQGLVMSAGNGRGPLSAFKNWYSFRARYAVLQSMRMGGVNFQKVVDYQNIDELTKKFAPYVLRRTKEECLDLPAKTYTVREIALSDATWKIYQELKKEAMLCLPDSEEKPEPNAAVRILRLCQLTSGHVGLNSNRGVEVGNTDILALDVRSQDVSSEKLSWLVNEILEGELSNEKALIVWCRWRRERERLLTRIHSNKLEVYQVFGGQSQKQRDDDIRLFQREPDRDGIRRILLAQPHAGGFGLTLTAASTAIFLSNDFSNTTRVQAEDRCHRIGQHHPCLYLDVLAVGPKGQKTIDHYVLECLRAKKSLADTTCKAWRSALED